MGRFKKEYNKIEFYLMKKNLIGLALIIFSLKMVMGQKSIQSSDIEIHSQLTFLRVSPEDKVDFEGGMQALGSLSKKVQLDEKFDWLTYKSNTNQYLVITFSDGLEDVLTLNDYQKTFQEKGSGESFRKTIQAMAKLDITVDKNYIIQMVLPWSTVEGISVYQFPLATMVEYVIPTDDIEQFDTAMRQLAVLLEETKYPYPLESNRGNIGAYGTMALVWFYDNRDNFLGRNSLLKWMDEHGQTEAFQKIMQTLETISSSTVEYRFDYQKMMSY